MKAIKVIKDPKAFYLFADETRRKIMHLLRVKEMNASQIAAELDLTPQAVYHHIKKLLKGELVEVSREERCGHLIESYYRATAELYSFSQGKTTAKSLRDKKQAEERIDTVLNVLKQLGFNIEYSNEKVSQLADLQEELEECCEDIDKIEEAIYEMNDLDLLTKKTVRSFASALLMSEEEFTRQHQSRKRFRQLLTSLIKK